MAYIEPELETQATPFVALIAVEADETLGDGNAGDPRTFPPEAFTWREPPATIHVLTSIPSWGHDGADVAGHVEGYKRLPSSDAGLRAMFGEVPGDFAVCAYGLFDTGPAGVDAARMVDELTLTGVSVDPGSDMDVQERCLEMEVDEFGPYCTRWEARFLSYEIAGFTIVDVPGIESTTIRVATPEDVAAYEALGDVGPGSGAEPVEDEEFVPADDSAEDGMAAALTASGLLGDRNPPPSSYFTRPEGTQLTAFTVGEPDGDGWIPVWGHVAPKEGSGLCHIGFPGECKEAPDSPSGYAHFNLGAFPTTDGDVAVGRVTMGCGHAPLRLGRRPVSAADAQGHYDHNGYVAAYVHAVNGVHGWWVAGVVRPSLTAEQVIDLKAGSLSGDWRGIGGKAEGVAALVVNVPGFPIPRQESLVASGRFSGMVAAGILNPRREVDGSVRTRLENLEREVARQKNLNAGREMESLTASLRRHTVEDVDLAGLLIRQPT